MAHSDPPPPSACSGAEGVSNTSADFCRLQSLRRTPPYVPTAPKVARTFAFCRPPALKSLICCKLFANRKFIKNRTPQKSSQNRKNRILDRKISISDGFREPFWHQFSIRFSIFLVKRRKHDSIVTQTISEEHEIDLRPPSTSSRMSIEYP